MESSLTSDVIPKHHQRLDLCTTRPAYRQGRDLRAVKVYTIHQESRHLLIHGVSAVGAGAELTAVCRKFGDIEEIRPLDDYPTEEFTEVYWVKYRRTQSARFAKKHLDDASMFGGVLHVCYAPEYETVDETRQKLLERRKVIATKTRTAQTTPKADANSTNTDNTNDETRTDIHSNTTLEIEHQNHEEPLEDSGFHDIKPPTTSTGTSEHFHGTTVSKIPTGEHKKSPYEITIPSMHMPPLTLPPPPPVHIPPPPPPPPILPPPMHIPPPLTLPPPMFKPPQLHHHRNPIPHFQRHNFPENSRTRHQNHPANPQIQHNPQQHNVFQQQNNRQYEHAIIPSLPPGNSGYDGRLCPNQDIHILPRPNPHRLQPMPPGCDVVPNVGLHFDNQLGSDSDSNFHLGSNSDASFHLNPNIGVDRFQPQNQSFQTQNSPGRLTDLTAYPDNPFIINNESQSHNIPSSQTQPKFVNQPALKPSLKPPLKRPYNIGDATKQWNTMYDYKPDNKQNAKEDNKQDITQDNNKQDNIVPKQDTKISVTMKNFERVEKQEVGSFETKNIDDLNKEQKLGENNRNFAQKSGIRSKKDTITQKTMDEKINAAVEKIVIRDYKPKNVSVPKFVPRQVCKKETKNDRVDVELKRNAFVLDKKQGPVLPDDFERTEVKTRLDDSVQSSVTAIRSILKQV